MSIDNFKVQELNTVEMKSINGGQNVGIGQCKGGTFDASAGGGGHNGGISWFQWYLYLT